MSNRKSFSKKVSTKTKGDKKFVKYKCDLVELAKHYSNWGNVPKYIGNMKAMEIALLAKAYLKYKLPTAGERGGEG